MSEKFEPITPVIFEGSPIFSIPRQGPAAKAATVFCSVCERALSRTEFSPLYIFDGTTLYTGECRHCAEKAWRELAGVDAGLRRFCEQRMASIVTAAMRQGVAVTIGAINLARAYQDQKGLCALSGTPLSLKPGQGEQNRQKAIVMRRDSWKGYHITNVMWTSLAAHKARADASLDTFIELCRKVAEHNPPF